MSKIALAMEGGGLRGVFTAGVVDNFLDNDIVFDYVVGVSAGACNSFAYLSGQKKYFHSILTKESIFDSFYGVPQMVESHRLIDLDKFFYDYTKKYNFNFDRLLNGSTPWDVVVSNMLTGKAEYMHAKDVDRARLIGKASCSLPIITSPVEIDGQLYMDGGVCDPIPVQRCLDMGYDKVVVVLTRKKGNYSSTNEATAFAVRRLYKEYPNFIDAIIDRTQLYKKQVELCEKLEEEGKVIIIRPAFKEVGRLESDDDQLSMAYFHGYLKAKETLDKIKGWA